VTNLWRTPSDLFDRHLYYEKGACVLHMLRYVLGEADFWRAIRHYVRVPSGVGYSPDCWRSLATSAVQPV